MKWFIYLFIFYIRGALRTSMHEKKKSWRAELVAGLLGNVSVGLSFYAFQQTFNRNNFAKWVVVACSQS